MMDDSKLGVLSSATSRIARSAGALAMLAGAVVLGDVRDAQACGGCFHPQAEVGSSVITDHRMVFKVSTNETILWDQVRYTGSPQEFAWVLPVREGAKVELSRDAWIAALDATTGTTVQGPERFCNGGGGSSSGGGGGCGSVGTTALSDNSARSSGAAVDGGFSGNGNVSVVSQGVIGPYQAVTLRAKDGKGISDWLIENDFAIPDNVKPTIDAYTAEKFDFIALRLRPGQGVQAMRPVRVVSPGADASLPLRMVAAGVGAKVGLTLWVVGEGRYRMQNFPNAVIDDTKLTWDGKLSKSNLVDLQNAAFASNDGRTWLTEVAMRASVSSEIFTQGGGLSLYATYNSACITRPPELVQCNADELPPSDGKPNNVTDAGADASTDGGDGGDGGIGDGETDASVTNDAGSSGNNGNCTKVVSGCEGFDDLEVATRGLHASDVWITRLRADLPVNALNADLRLEAADQTPLSGTHKTDKFTDPTFDPCAGTGNNASPNNSSDDGCACRSTARNSGSLGTWLIMGLTAVLASKIVRRRRR